MPIARRNLLFGLFLLVLFIAAFGFIRRLTAISLNTDVGNSSYIILVPFISAVLIYIHRARIFCNLKNSVMSALVAFAVGGLICFVGRSYGGQLAESDYLGLMTLAVIAFGFSGFLLIYGSSAFKAAIFPLLFMGLAVPIPSRILDEIVFFLRTGSADAVSMLFSLTRTPFYRNDFIFVLPKVSIEVAEECSGIRSTIGMFIVTLLAAHMLLRSNWRKTALLVAVVPISLLKNAVRIVTLTLLAVHVDMGFLKGSLHHDGGILFMLVGLCLMYPILAYLVKTEEKTYLDSEVHT